MLNQQGGWRGARTRSRLTRARGALTDFGVTWWEGDRELNRSRDATPFSPWGQFECSGVEFPPDVPLNSTYNFTCPPPPFISLLLSVLPPKVIVSTLLFKTIENGVLEFTFF